MSVVREAIEAAAEAGDPNIGSSFGPTTSSRRREARTRATILRFLENVPEGMTVLEIRREIEGGDDVD